MKLKKGLAVLTITGLLATPLSGVYAQNANTTIEVSDALNIGRTTNQRGSTIRLEEMNASSWESGESFVLRLPEGATWTTGTLVNGVRVSNVSINERELTVRPRVTDNLDTVVVVPEFNVSREVGFGNFEVTVIRGNLAPEDQVVTIGQVRDYEIELSRQGNVGELNFGDVSQKQVTIFIEETIPGSLVSNLDYELLLEGAKFDESRQVRIVTREGNRNLSSSFKEGGLVLSTPISSSEVGRWEINFALTPDKEFVGDITLKLQGREVDQDVVIFNISETVGLNVTTPTSVALGRQNQADRKSVV